MRLVAASHFGVRHVGTIEKVSLSVAPGIRQVTVRLCPSIMAEGDGKRVQKRLGAVVTA